MLLGFKRQFAPMVLDGTKTHTIRGLRKIAPRVGDIAHCYVDPRQKTMRLLGRWPIIRVESIEIVATYVQTIPLAIWIEDQRLRPDEMNQFLWMDGFRDKGGETYEAIHQAAEFWKDRLEATVGPWRGHVIHWGRV